MASLVTELRIFWYVFDHHGVVDPVGWRDAVLASPTCDGLHHLAKLAIFHDRAGAA
jgi:sterol desaturase/sphingolipid hydroxylase (fatty acid hydroxylase superfamily)